MGTKIVVGLFLLGALVVFGIGTFYVEDWGLALQEGRVLRARFKSAENISEGNAVSIQGVRVGKVKTVSVSSEPGTEYPVEIDLWVRADVEVRADDSPTITVESIFGGKYVSIVRGDPKAAPLKEGDFMKAGEVAPDIPELIVEAKAALEGFEKPLAEADKAIRNLTEITDQIRKGEGTVGKLIYDEKAYKDLAAAAEDAREAFKQVAELSREAREGKGLLGKLMKDEKLSEDVSALVENARKASENLAAITADVREGKGTAGKLFSDDALYKEASETLKSLREVTDKIARGEGTIGKLVQDPEAYKSLMASLENIENFTTELREGKGTVGKLVRDDELYEQLRLAVKGLQEAIQDYREQSPIITFTGVVFGAF
jgi:phospholipid/cholesterol/gamma-HCH transport system substrate-binding protein